MWCTRIFLLGFHHLHHFLISYIIYLLLQMSGGINASLSSSQSSQASNESLTSPPGSNNNHQKHLQSPYTAVLESSPNSDSVNDSDSASPHSVKISGNSLRSSEGTFHRDDDRLAESVKQTFNHLAKSNYTPRSTYHTPPYEGESRISPRYPYNSTPNQSPADLQRLFRHNPPSANMNPFHGVSESTNYHKT